MPQSKHSLEERVRLFCESSAFFHYLGMRFSSGGEGFCEISLPLAPHHLQHTGVVHGGVIAALADQAGAAAAFTLLPDGKTLVAADFKIQFLRASRGERLLCRGTVLKPGRMLSFVEADIFCFAEEGVKTHTAKFTATMASVSSAGTPQGQALP